MFWFRKKKGPPSREAAARRLLALKYVVSYALLVPPRGALEEMMQQWSAAERETFVDEAPAKRDRFWERVRECGLMEELSAWERELAQATPVSMSFQQQRQATWRLEGVLVLMWSLGLVDELPPYGTLAGRSLLRSVPSADPGAFVETATLRPREEIEKARTTAELWHWRSRTRQLMESGQILKPDVKMKAAGLHTFDDIVRRTAIVSHQKGTIPEPVEEDFPVMGKAYRELSPEEWAEVQSMTFERHFALNWLCGRAPNNDWDRTPTST